MDHGSPESDLKKFFRAISSGSLPDVENLCKFVHLKKINCNGICPLLLAVDRGDPGIVQYLIKRSADVNCCSPKKERPIHWAIRRNNLEIVRYLVDKEADVECEDESKQKPIHVAAEGGFCEIVEYLINEKHVNINCQNENRQRPIHLAAKGGFVGVVKCLINAKAEVNCEEGNGHYPVHWAAQGGHKAILELLLAVNDANATCLDWHKHQPMHLAAREGHIGVVELLIKMNVDVNCKNKFGWTPLHMAAARGHENVVQKLLDNGAEVNSVNKYGQMPIHWASHRGYVAVVQKLIDRDARIEHEDNNGWSPIHMAAQKGAVDVVQLLLKKRASSDCKNKRLHTPMHLAAWGGYVKVLDALGKYVDVDALGEYVDVVDEDGLTPLHMAALKGHNDVVSWLLDHEANIECEDQYGWRPIHWAMQNGHIDVMNFLIKRGAYLSSAVSEPAGRIIYRDDHDDRLNVVQCVIDHDCKDENEVFPPAVSNRNGHENNDINGIHAAARNLHITDVENIVLHCLFQIGCLLNVEDQIAYSSCPERMRMEQDWCGELLDNRNKSHFVLFKYCRNYQPNGTQTATAVTLPVAIKNVKFSDAKPIDEECKFQEKNPVLRMLSRKLCYPDYVVLDCPDEHATLEEYKHWKIMFCFSDTEAPLNLQVKSFIDDLAMLNVNLKFQHQEIQKEFKDLLTVSVQFSDNAIVELTDSCLHNVKMLIPKNMKMLKVKEMIIETFIICIRKVISDNPNNSNQRMLYLLNRFVTCKRNLLEFLDGDNTRLYNSVNISETSLMQNAKINVKLKSEFTIEWIPPVQSKEEIERFLSHRYLVMKCCTEDKLLVVSLEEDMTVKTLVQTISAHLDHDGRILLMDSEKILDEESSTFCLDEFIYYALVLRNPNIERLDQIDEGSFGKVFKCKEKGNPCLFALKCMRLNNSDREEGERSMLKEFVAAANVGHHDRIMKYVAIYEMLKSDECKYSKICIRMELMKESLSSHLEDVGPLPDSEVIRFSKQILEGLDFLHDHKIVHRDIKGQNILLDADKNVKIADFGLSKVLSVNSSNIGKRCNRSNGGTFCYMAPEMIGVDSHMYGVKCDVWSFGAVVVEMVTGKPPFSGKCVGEIVNILRNEKRIPINPQINLSKEVKDVLCACLHGDPNERPECKRLLTYPLFMENNF